MKKQNKMIIKKWWFWLIIIVILFIALFNKTELKNEEINNNLEIENVSNTNIEQEKNNEYAEDIVINNFIKNFKSVSSYQLTDIKMGNINTKYFVNINGQYCELLNATDNEANYFEIIINGGNEKDDVDKISNVYKEVIKSLDSTITEAQINDTIVEYINSNTKLTTFSINDKINVTYYPCIEMSYGNSDCRIEITTTVYNENIN